jgi:hypothetical protein
LFCLPILLGFVFWLRSLIPSCFSSFECVSTTTTTTTFQALSCLSICLSVCLCLSTVFLCLVSLIDLWALGEWWNCVEGRWVLMGFPFPFSFFLV